jgi:Short C-terminal domain
MNLIGRASIFVTLALAVGCGPEDPSVRYSGSTVASRPQASVQVFRTTLPDRPFQELGSVEVSCPTQARGGGFAVVVDGGCTFDQALQMATAKAAESGADAIVRIDSSAAANGNIVSMQAVAVRFTGPAKPAAPPIAAKPTAEERLKKLKALADQGLITEDEYTKRKAEILSEL